MKRGRGRASGSGGEENLITGGAFCALAAWRVALVAEWRAVSL